MERSGFARIVADGWEGVNGRVLEDVFGRMDDLILCVGSWSEEKMFHHGIVIMICWRVFARITSRFSFFGILF